LCQWASAWACLYSQSTADFLWHWAHSSWVQSSQEQAAERIEQVVTPIKDLFGAVFFISVGMMVQPDIIVSYWFPIVVLSLVVICGMIIFGTFGMLVTGQTLKVAIQSGFSLTQIGEFAFIIASLGMSLGVLDSTIYPIIVAVSVITTFTTPYFIKMSVPCYNLIENLHFLINRYQEEASKENATGRAWHIVLRRYLWRTTVYCIILIAIVIVGHKYIMPWMDAVSPRWSHELCTFITLGAMSPFLVALMMPISGSYTKDIKSPLQVNNNIPRIVMSIFRFIIALAFIAYVIGWAYSARAAVGVIAMVFVILVLLFSSKLKVHLRQM
jgi:CPA2 family monovalent cation:H+ antiporter-2